MVSRSAKQPIGYRVPATVSIPALLRQGSDRQFRGLIQDLLTVARRVEMARDYLGRQIKVTGPQYQLLMTVAQLEGASGIGVGSVAQAMHVSSAFVTAEAGKLSQIGFLKKQPNPNDGRGALLKLTPVGRRRIHGLIAEIRTVNDLFFGSLSGRSFADFCQAAESLVAGSRKATQYMAGVEEDKRT